MKNKSKLGAIAAAMQLEMPPTPDKELASFTFILESREGYVAEGYYPNVTKEQYATIVRVLENKTIILPVGVTV